MPSPNAAATNATAVAPVPPGRSKPSVNSDEPAVTKASVIPWCSMATKRHVKPASSRRSHATTSAISTTGA